MLTWSIIHGQGLPPGLEAGDDLAAVHAGLDDLQRDLALHGVGLLGHEDGAHAAFADLLQQLVWADDGARGFRGRRRGAVALPRQILVHSKRRGHGRPLQETSRTVMCFQQRIDPLPQLGIGAALAVEEGGPAGRVRFFGGREEDGLNALEIDWHGMSLHLGSPYSATFVGKAVEKN